MAEAQAPAPPSPVDPNSEVKAFSSTGEKITILAKDAAQLEAAGGSVATNRDIQQARIDALPTAAKVAKVATGDAGFWLQGGQFTPEGSTFTKGVASGATMGLSDLAAKGVGQAVGGDKLATQLRDTSNAYDAESPLAAKLGEGVGMVAGAVAGGAMTGGVGLSAEAAQARNAMGLGKLAFGMPSVGISALGGAAESAVARATAGMLARGALGRAGSTALQWAARGAVEGALMEGMHQTTDDLFNDHELAADKILIAAGKGGLYGGAVGGIMGGLGSLAKSGAQGGLAALRGTAASVAERTEGALAKLEGAAARVEGQADDAVNVARQAKNHAAVDAGALERVERGVGETATSAERKASAGFLEKQANERAFAALGGTKKDLTAIRKNIGDDAEQVVGRWLHENNLVQAGDSVADLMPRLQAKQATEGQIIGSVVEKYNARIPVSALEASRDSVANGLMKKAGTVDAATKVLKAHDNVMAALRANGAIAEDGTVSLAQLLEQRRSVADIAYEAGAGGSKLSKGAVKKYERALEEHVMNGLDEAARKAGDPAASAAYQTAKTNYRNATKAIEVAEHGMDRLGGNMPFGLGDKVLATAGAILGAVGGGGVGGFAGASAMAGASYLARTRGNATAAVLLSRMAQRNAAEAALHTFDDVATRAASGMMKVAGKADTAERYIAGNAARQAERGYASGARKASTEGVQSRARAGMEEVKRLQDPATMQAHIDGKLGMLRQTAPKLADAMAFRMQQTAQFLADKMPEETKSYAPISAPSRKSSINPVQAARFLRYQEVAENPQSAFDRFSRGEVRREDVEFMRECAPKAFETLQVRVLQRLTAAQDKGVTVPHEQRLKLSLLLDIKGDAMLEPGMFRVLQKNVSSPPSGQGAGGPQQAPKRPVQLASTQLTGMDKLEQ